MAMPTDENLVFLSPEERSMPGETDTQSRLEYRVPNSNAALPDIDGHGWKAHSPNRYDCGTTTVSSWQHSRQRPAGERERVPGTFECVTTNPADYLVAHGVRKLDIPKYYSRFHDEFEAVVTEWTVRKRGIAVGVDANLLERAVRLANGKGHIDHDTLAIYLCDNSTLFVAGARGVFIVDQIPLKRWHLDQTPPDSASTPIRWFDVPEADADYRRGLRRFIDAFEKYADASLASYDHLSDGTHIFRTTSERAVYVNRAVLTRLVGMALDETGLHDTYTHTLDGKTYESTWDETTTAYDIGDETRRGIVLGFDHCWYEQEYVMGNGVYQLHSQVRYVCLSFRPDMYEHYDFEVVYYEDDIDTFEPGG